MNAAISPLLVVVVHHYPDFSIQFNKFLMFVCWALLSLLSIRCLLNFIL